MGAPIDVRLSRSNRADPSKFPGWGLHRGDGRVTPLKCAHSPDGRPYAQRQSASQLAIRVNHRNAGLTGFICCGTAWPRRLLPLRCLRGLRLFNRRCWRCCWRDIDRFSRSLLRRDNLLPMTHLNGLIDNRCRICDSSGHGSNWTFRCRLPDCRNCHARGGYCRLVRHPLLLRRAVRSGLSAGDWWRRVRRCVGSGLLSRSLGRCGLLWFSWCRFRLSPA